jgi:hypothetical protein
MYMCPIPNCSPDRALSLYGSRTVDKKEILRTDSDTGIYFSSDKVGTVYGSATLVRSWTFFQFLDLFKQLVGLLGRGISPTKDLYLHRTTRTE